MTEHFLGLEGANTIGTEYFLATQNAIGDLVARYAMGAFVGDAGLGKTFSVETARGLITDVPTCRVVMPHHATMRRMARLVLEAVTGEEHHAERFRLGDDLVRALSEQPHLIVIDEAQNANLNCIEFLRHIHDDPRTRFAVAFAGGHRCWEVLCSYPMLRSRIHRNVQFKPMSLQTVLQVMPGFHPIFADADPDVLGRIDLLIGHGTFRDWTAFTVDAIAAANDNALDTVDDWLVDEVMQRRQGQHANRSEIHAA